MSSRDNLWVSALKDNSANPTDEIIPFMEKQCCDLEAASEEAAHARFAEIRYVPKDPSLSEMGAIATLTKFSQLIDAYGTVEENALPQKDIGGTYEKKTYGFDIYSDNYKYRPFMLMIGPTYPIELSIDETIWRESRDQFLDYLPVGDRDHSDSTICLESFYELKGCFQTIVESRKMKYVLRRLIEDKQSR